MSSGGKGGTQTTTMGVPAWVEEPARRNLERAEQISQIGYTPYYGPDVAAFTPQQTASFNNANTMADAYGMSGGAISTPTPQTFAGGVQGYSSAPGYEQSVAALEHYRPGQYQAIQDQFIDPYSGVDPASPYAAMTSQQAVDPVTGWGVGGGDYGYGDGGGYAPTGASYDPYGPDITGGVGGGVGGVK